MKKQPTTAFICFPFSIFPILSFWKSNLCITLYLNSVAVSNQFPRALCFLRRLNLLFHQNQWCVPYKNIVLNSQKVQKMCSKVCKTGTCTFEFSLRKLNF